MTDRELDVAIAEEFATRAFICPRCGSRHFGSRLNSNYEVVERFCHDEFGLACMWRGKPGDAIAPYSRCWSAAGEVLQTMRERSGPEEMYSILWVAFTDCFDPHIRGSESPGEYDVSIVLWHLSPRRICEAALIATRSERKDDR
jgi:hypothetical protein